MADTVIIDAATLVLDGTDWTGSTKKIELSGQLEEKETTTFSDGGAKSVRGGQESGTLKVTFNNDFDASGLDATMWTAFKARQPITFAVKVDEAATSTTNPKYTGKCLVKAWTPINGSPGDLAEVSLDMPCSGPLVRNTSD